MAQDTSMFEHRSFSQGEDILLYRVLYPANFDAAKRYPVVVFLHGSGARGQDNLTQLSNVPDVLYSESTMQKYPHILLVPQCPEGDAWVNFPDFPQSLQATTQPTVAGGLVLRLIDEMCNYPYTDTNRIYITGYSMGGEGTYDLVARRPDLFAAAVPVCPVADTATAQRIKAIPIWNFHGAADAVNGVVYSQMMIQALEQAGGHPKYTEYKDEGHRTWLMMSRSYCPGCLHKRNNASICAFFCLHIMLLPPIILNIKRFYLQIVWIALTILYIRTSVLYLNIVRPL